ncbi:hypothetical protein QJS04_geneDACA009568 [Acorus gramineus]|uniref:Uncharacterized protein n=1 Tax=Acorus gramineus TaxID=55184 RepID=A0AAV9AH59_ACOGR|nr:hypothetical protein QJS04_geneDACA009568 [Acorus gramineus]
MLIDKQRALEYLLFALLVLLWPNTKCCPSRHHLVKYTHLPHNFLLDTTNNDPLKP